MVQLSKAEKLDRDSTVESVDTFCPETTGPVKENWKKKETHRIHVLPTFTTIQKQPHVGNRPDMDGMGNIKIFQKK